MDYVKYGVIGSGAAWRLHLIGIKKIPKIKLISMFDIRNAKMTARANKTDFYDNFDEFLKSDIDTVMIFTPHYLHEKYVLASNYLLSSNRFLGYFALNHGRLE
ncbi:MAG: Gfo/Idh/MocA family oxidoreductase [Promethearchaeota archaeon]